MNITCNIHEQPIASRINWIFDLAQRYSAEFCSPESFLARERYLALHPSAIAVMKCMDGRINIPVATRTPPGIIQPFRNLGGMFDMGWPHLGEVLAQYVQRMVKNGRRVLILITYHFSRGDVHRGCSGFDCDKEAAIAHTRQIRSQVEAIFGAAHDSVYPLICGFETDEDALLLHSADGRILDLSCDLSLDELAAELAILFQDMPLEMRCDLLPLLAGNMFHIAGLRQERRMLTIEHREWMICLGRGFDFLHTPNLALIIGPYSPDLADPIRKAAAIIEKNMAEGRIPGDGFLLLASVPYDEIGVDRARAVMKSIFLSNFAAEVIEREFPALAGKMIRKNAVLDWNSRRIETLSLAG
jgi:Carboxysome Shell Carbonic Anhydrase, catalytic domain